MINQPSFQIVDSTFGGPLVTRSVCVDITEVLSCLDVEYIDIGRDRENSFFVDIWTDQPFFEMERSTSQLSSGISQ